jgi:uncharacterized protein
MTRPVESFSAAQARRIALAAQGLAKARPAAVADGPLPASPNGRALLRAVDRLGLLQIDSVNVLVRAHYMPLFSRLGPYAATLLDEAAYRRRHLFEYWGHEASLLPMRLQPLLRWRMARAEQGVGIYGGLARFGRERRPYIDAILAELADRGPLSAGELSEGGRGKGSWWGWSDGKRALEWLFWAGLVTVCSRRGFERVYDLPERVLPAAVLAAPTPPVEDAQRALLRIAAEAMGIATERDLRDYFRMDVADARARIAELVENGDLLPVTVRDWDRPAYLAPSARLPRRVHAQALLSPFDPLVWERSRAERLFGFRYRIEIYTPAHKREHGYYVLPFLLGERMAARVDLKADRQKRQLCVLAAHAEPGVDIGETAAALAETLGCMTGWLGLDGISVADRGDLAAALRSAEVEMRAASGSPGTVI